MITSALVDVDRVYKFEYAGKVRVAWTLEEVGAASVRCWDFTNDGYRCFNIDRMTNITDVTNHAVIKQTMHVHSEKMAEWDYDPKVHVHFENGMVCAVRY